MFSKWAMVLIGLHLRKRQYLQRPTIPSSVSVTTAIFYLENPDIYITFVQHKPIFNHTKNYHCSRQNISHINFRNPMSLNINLPVCANGELELYRSPYQRSTMARLKQHNPFKTNHIMTRFHKKCRIAPPGTRSRQCGGMGFK